MCCPVFFSLAGQTEDKMDAYGYPPFVKGIDRIHGTCVIVAAVDYFKRGIIGGFHTKFDKKERMPCGCLTSETAFKIVKEAGCQAVRPGCYYKAAYAGICKCLLVETYQFIRLAISIAV